MYHITTKDMLTMPNTINITVVLPMQTVAFVIQVYSSAIQSHDEAQMVACKQLSITYMQGYKQYLCDSMRQTDRTCISSSIGPRECASAITEQAGPL